MSFTRALDLQVPDRTLRIYSREAEVGSLACVWDQKEGPAHGKLPVSCERGHEEGRLSRAQHTNFGTGIGQAVQRGAFPTRWLADQAD